MWKLFEEFEQKRSRINFFGSFHRNEINIYENK